MFESVRPARKPANNPIRVFNRSAMFRAALEVSTLGWNTASTMIAPPPTTTDPQTVKATISTISSPVGRSLSLAISSPLVIPTLTTGAARYRGFMVEINLSPAEVNVAGIRAGDRNLFQLTIRQSGVALNLTGYTITAQARTAPPDPEALDADVEITNAVAGKCDVRWPGDAVRTWLGTNTVQKGVWDLQLLNTGDPGSDPWTIIAGTFAAELDITHPPTD